MPMPVTVTTPSDREIVVSRVFDAPAELVWACHTKPELVRRWMLGPPGWSMPARRRYGLAGTMSKMTSNLRPVVVTSSVV